MSTKPERPLAARIRGCIYTALSIAGVNKFDVRKELPAYVYRRQIQCTGED